MISSENPFGIINTRGEHPPNGVGELLCNGHCDWKECDQDAWRCMDCGYIECLRCFFDAVEEYWKGRKVPNDPIDPLTEDWDYKIKNIPCRNCGVIGKPEEYHPLQEEAKY